MTAHRFAPCVASVATVQRGAERRALEVVGFEGRTVQLRWPATGPVAFSLVDGAGPGGWYIDPHDVPALIAAEHAAFNARNPDRVQRAHHAALWNDRETPGRLRVRLRRAQRAREAEQPGDLGPLFGGKRR